MERRVWLRSKQIDLYPNLYTVLIGPPGIGKGLATNRVEDLLTSIPEFPTAPNSVSKASLMDTLEAAKRRPVIKGKIYEYNSLMIIANEMGSFFPAYDDQLTIGLTDIYDGRRYREVKRTGEVKIDIAAPILNFLAGVTPSWIKSNFPEGAWDQGLVSRMIFVYSGEIKIGRAHV